MNLDDIIYKIRSFKEYIETRYPNYKKILLINLIGFPLYFLISNFIAKRIIVIILIALNTYFKEIRFMVMSFAPVILWLTLFSSCQNIPNSWRRPIDVETLISLDKKLGYISHKLYQMHNDFFDIMAWIPYGVIHYILPYIVLFYLMIYHTRIEISAYAIFFGLFNYAGVITELCWPTAPPWYYTNYPDIPANYDIHGNPGDLKRIDDLFNVKFYEESYNTSTIVWGAWPSLHSGVSVYIVTFMCYLKPKLSPIIFWYVPWIWFATMYLGHHFLVDLIGGFMYGFPAALLTMAYIIYMKSLNERNYNELRSVVIEDVDDGGKKLTNQVSDASIKSMNIEPSWHQYDNNKKFSTIPEEEMSREINYHQFINDNEKVEEADWKEDNEVGNEERNSKELDRRFSDKIIIDGNPSIYLDDDEENTDDSGSYL
ncbi:PAP2-domain-containing protein [Neocallimastix lanati (nom. inval.)]|uniref:PAP2-domain-containing protein n=1 Tax=Neocallimastix californiae TaxID=1754190 RepID=A0A1Y2DCA2_9FUNG|nr:PAP2-domain-containing protein [Neocallimastix sp. JGI-2020a]ORY56774.1 PAP2-domain-containing protein [Neocallimastix californiae]|eukprot:ORY56774.1 PAP2-domain-containing protein [Neocallimastix californiae]